MAPKQIITMRDLVKTGKDTRVRTVFERAVKLADEYQQETLKKAKKI